MIPPGPPMPSSSRWDLGSGCSATWTIHGSRLAARLSRSIGNLCASWIEWLNAAAWDDPFITILMAHPDDRDRLAGLPAHRDLRPNAYGPYRGRCTERLFD